MPRSTIRFAFAITAGANAGLACPGWRVWVHGEDTYLAAKSVGGIWKVSLHADAAWRLAVTQEHLATAAEPVLPAGHDRAPWTFTPTAFTGGQRLAFAVLATRGALRPEPLDPREELIPVEDRWDRVAVAYLRMAEPGAAAAARANQLGPTLQLTSGRQVWLSWGAETVAASDPEPVPAGSMLEPRWPGRDEVTAPGLVVRGVHVA